VSAKPTDPYRAPCGRCAELQARINELEAAEPKVYPYNSSEDGFVYCNTCGKGTKGGAGFKTYACDGLIRHWFRKASRRPGCPLRQHLHRVCPRCSADVREEPAR
jgi:hypothetical protein